MDNIYIIIVTFFPNKSHMVKMKRIFEKCNCSVVIVDNSKNDTEISENNFGKTKVIKLGDNYGIAVAQNIGIRYAIEHNADIIGFFDQDSSISEQLIYRLIKSLQDQETLIVAPRSIDSLTKEEYPSQIVSRIGIPRDIYTDSKRTRTSVDIVISSGTFVKTKVFDKVGLFDESFFIDFVDIEWCLRCRRSGIKIWVIRDAVMEHKIGNKTKKIGKMTINIHSPYRTYYKVRNSLLLLFRGLNPLFVFTQIMPAVIKNFILIFDKEKGKEYRKYYFQGIFDGIRNRGGKYEKWHEQ